MCVCVLSGSLWVLQKHGLKSASSRQRARAAAEGEADEMMALKGRLAVVNEEVRLFVGWVTGWGLR